MNSFFRDSKSKFSETRNIKIGKSIVEVGRFTYGAEKMRVKDWGEGAKLKIGSFCSISSELTVFLGGNHRIDWISTFPFGHIFTEELGGTNIKGHPQSNGDVIIGNDVWIGHGVTILSGVKIGDGAVIAANSNVVKDVEPYSIIGGNPAKKIKMRFDADIIDALLELRWWDLELSQIIEIQETLCAAPKLSQILELIAIFRNN